jgi:hypothetical protein
MPAAAKVAPGIDHELVPDGVETEWVSFAGGLKEAVLWSAALATNARRRATVLPARATLVGTGGEAPPVGPPLRYLYDPDPAVVRAHLVAELAELVGGRLLDPTTAYVTSDELIATPFARPFEIVEVMPFSLKRLRQALRARGTGAVTIMKRGSAVDVERLRHDLTLSGDGHAVVVLALVERHHHALIARTLAPSPGRAATPAPVATARTQTRA